MPDRVTVRLTVNGVAHAGPVMLAGHDADDHGFQSLYAGLMNNVYTNATNGGTGILALGVNGSTADGWITGVAGLMGVPVTIASAATLGTVSFAGYRMLYVPSDNTNTSGGISQTQNNILTSRSAHFAAFVNAGGGLFGLTQDQFTDQYGYVTGSGGLGSLTTATISSSGCIDPGCTNVYDNIDPTPAGSALGITSTNLDGCCWHNAFTTFPSFLSMLAYANEPGTFLDGVAAIIGGATVVLAPQVPLPASLFLVGLGLATAGVARRRFATRN